MESKVASGDMSGSLCCLAAVLVSLSAGCGDAVPESGSPHMESPQTQMIPEVKSTPVWNPFRDDPVADEVTSPFRFSDVAREAGVEFITYGSPSPEHYMTEQNGSGVALLDFDADGWLDLFFANGSHPDRPADQAGATHRFFRNVEPWRYSDATNSAGLAETGFGMGCAAGDFDSDGFVDLFLAGYDRNRLWRNNGDGTWSEVALPESPFDHRWSVSATFADFDADGFPDLYVANYVDYRFEDGACFTQHQPDPVMIPCGPLGRQGQPDTLLRNQGNGVFHDISDDAGISPFDGKGLGVTVADFNGDSLLDIYVANDTTQNLQFENQGNLQFSETGLTNGVAFGADGRARSGMGVACGDCNGDGFLDLVVTNFQHEPYDLFLGSENSGFVARNREMGLDTVTRSVLGFGVCFGDFDLDADLDLFIANGHVWDLASLNLGYQYAMPSQLLQNDPAQRFLDVSPTSGEWFRQPRVGRAATIGDLDNDGDEDLLVMSLDLPAALLRNDSLMASDSVSLRLIGVESARDPRGVRVDIKVGNEWLTRRVTAGDSFQAAGSPQIVVAIKGQASIDTIRVHWPGRPVEEFYPVPTGRTLTLIEGGHIVTGNSRS